MSLMSAASSGFLRGACYYRMSSEHQRYSIENQAAMTEAYAGAHGIQIVRTYRDVAKSGLSLAGRSALVQLLQDVISGAADYDVILVYDISRWGRFLDNDESAHYEFLCRSAGVDVRYCAEPIDMAGMPAGLFKVLKRAMAAEYSREVSIKTFAGLCSITRRGYHGAGSAPYGLRRMLIGADGAPRRELQAGERKSLQSERIKLVPGPRQEIETVRRVFNMFVVDRLSEENIVKALNLEAIPVGHSGAWRIGRVHKMLSNEVYIGTSVYNRKTQRLGGKVRPNPPDQWVRCEGAIEPIIDRPVFNRAQELIAARWRNKSDQEVLAALKALAQKVGTLTKEKIERSPEVPNPIAFRKRFGGLLQAYTLIGHPIPKYFGHSRGKPEINRAVADLKEAFYATVFDVGATVEEESIGVFRVNDQFSLRLTVTAATVGRRGESVWRLVRHKKAPSDVTVVARMDAANCRIEDYYFVPAVAFTSVTLALARGERSRNHMFRNCTLRPLSALCLLRQLGRPFPRSCEDFALLIAE